MALINNVGQASLKSDLVGAFDSIQETRSAMLEEVRSLQLSARVLMLAEAQRLKAEADSTEPGDPRPARYLAAGEHIAQRVAVLDVESSIARLRVAPAARLVQAGDAG